MKVSTAIRRSALLASALCLGLLWACSADEEDSPEPAREDLVRRARVAALFAEERYAEASRELEPLIQRYGPAPEDLVSAAILALTPSLARDPDPEAARALLERAREGAPQLPAVHYNLGVLEEEWGELEAAIGHLERAHALAPEDYPTHLKLANLYSSADRFDEAAPHYEALLAVGLDFGGSWYLTTLYRYGSLQMQLGEVERSREVLIEFELLKGRGLFVPVERDLRQGTFGRIHTPAGLGTRTAHPEAAPDFADEMSILTELTAIGGLGTHTPTASWSALSGTSGYQPVLPIPPPALTIWGGDGLTRVEALAFGDPDRLWSESIDALEPFDLNDDGELDYWVAAGNEVRLLVTREGALESDGRIPGELPGVVRALVAIDYDHEGDLDLVLAGDFGARLWRNDGAGKSPDGVFVDATAESGLELDQALHWCVAEDYDTDQDVDLLFGGPAGCHLADNLRGGNLALESGRVADLPVGEDPPLVADLDADARPDLFFGGADPRLYFLRPSGAYREVDAGPGSAGRPTAIDLDRDGALDALWPGQTKTGLRLALGQEGELASSLPGGGRHLAARDLDGNGEPDLALAGESGILVRYGTGTDASSLRLALRGLQDNHRGVGAVVELLAGPLYRRVFWRGEPVTFGLGDQTRVDVLRVLWPNGVVQYAVDLPANEDFVVIQKEGLAGSCPFLYSWNGQTYEFISDVIGNTPLGLPMGPGMLVPPDHDEYVLILGEQLAPRDGVLEVQFTEELREVTYLDHAHLVAVDHPAGTEVWPDERFCFPPFPEAHTHSTRDPLSPSAAPGSDGRDWAAELAIVDGDYSAPFKPLTGQFLGLATPHTLELRFDPERVKDAEKLRLVLTGWFYWTCASINMATARTPGVDFVPPILQVPDGQGGWRDTGPPVGFPAGKTKTMILDVTELLDREDPRLRLFSTLRLYWDSIRLAVDADDAPLVTTRLEPVSAELWERGYSEAQVVHPEFGLEWFEWELVESQPRWNQHPGLYTRFGECLPLLTEVDDQLVIMGAGDALAVRFDAGSLPQVPPGWRRDYLLYLDGWAKDRDPNTHAALYVEPLPFHGMSGYPYGPDEHFPDDEAHRAWRREWNTRPAKQWIRPLAPGAHVIPPPAVSAGAIR